MFSRSRFCFSRVFTQFRSSRVRWSARVRHVWAWIVPASWALSRAYVPAAFDDWATENEKETPQKVSFEFLDKWLALLIESDTVAMKIVALRMLCQFATTPDNARYLIEETECPAALRTVARDAIKRGNVTYQRLVLRMLDSLSAAQPNFQDSLLIDNTWMQMIDHWSLIKDDKTSGLVSRLMLRFASGGALARHLSLQSSDALSSETNQKFNADQYIISILQNLLEYEGASNEVLTVTSAAISAAANSSQPFCVRIGGSAVLQRLKSLSEKQSENMEVQLNVSEFLKCFAETGAAAPSSRLNAVLLGQGWMPLINQWAHSKNKDLKLNTVRILGYLVQDDEMAVKIMAEYGVQLFLDVASGLDIDIQHAVQDTLAVLTTPREYTSGAALSSKYHYSSTSSPFSVSSGTPEELFASTEKSNISEERLDDEFNTIRATSLLSYDAIDAKERRREEADNLVNKWHPSSNDELETAR